MSELSPIVLPVQRSQTTIIRCFCNRVVNTGTNCNKLYENQATVGSIFWALRKLKMPRSREKSSRGYALHSVCPQLPFFLKFSKPVSGFRKFDDVAIWCGTVAGKSPLALVTFYGTVVIPTTLPLLQNYKNTVGRDPTDVGECWKVE